MNKINAHNIRGAIYMYKVLKLVYSDAGVSSKAMSIINRFVNDIFERSLPILTNQRVILISQSAILVNKPAVLAC